jgi:hypothetical protein
MSCGDCAICYDSIEAADGFLTLSCKHVFHILCGTSWFAKQDKGTCPLCRKEMGEKDDLARISVEDEDDEDEDEEDDDEDDDETYEAEDEEDYSAVMMFSRNDLNTLLISLGGAGMTASMSSIFHASLTPSLHGEEHVTWLDLSQFRDICIGNGARHVATVEWQSIVEEQVAKREAMSAQQRAAEILASGPSAPAPAPTPTSAPVASPTPAPVASPTLSNLRAFSWHLLNDGNLVHKILNPEEYSGISIADAHRLPHRIAISRTEALWTAHECTTTIQAAWRGFKTRATIRA